MLNDYLQNSLKLTALYLILRLKNLLKSTCYPIKEERNQQKAKDITSKGLQLFIHDEKELFEKYIKKIFYAIKQVFDYGVQEKYVTDNPMKNVERTICFDTPKKEMKYWTLEDFDRFCNAPIEYNDHYLFIYFYTKWVQKR